MHAFTVFLPFREAPPTVSTRWVWQLSSTSSRCWPGSSRRLVCLHCVQTASQRLWPALPRQHTCAAEHLAEVSCDSGREERKDRGRRGEGKEGERRGGRRGGEEEREEWGGVHGEGRGEEVERRTGGDQYCNKMYSMLATVKTDPQITHRYEHTSIILYWLSLVWARAM